MTSTPVRPRDTVAAIDPPPRDREREHQGDGNDDEDIADSVYEPTDAEEDTGENMKPKEFEPESKRPKTQKKDPAESQDPFTCSPCGNYRIPKTLNSPLMPSAEDVDNHYVTHFPYRNWCPVCVESKGKEDGHITVEDANKGGLPIISLDYQEHESEQEEKKDPGMKAIIGKDESTGNVIAHYIEKKGPGDEWLMKKIAKDIEELGRRDITLKTDGEPAMIAVQSKIQELRPGKTIPRNPPAYNPQSNGPCEKAVQDVTGHLRCLKIGLEARLKAAIPVDAEILKWAIEHAAFLINRFSVGHDGMAPHERLTGRKWRRALVEFGELVRGKLVLKKVGRGKQKQQRKKLAPRWIEGVW